MQHSFSQPYKVVIESFTKWVFGEPQKGREPKREPCQGTRPDQENKWEQILESHRRKVSMGLNISVLPSILGKKK